MSIPAAIRSELIRRAREKKLRQAEFSFDEPCDWRPWQVLHPETGLPFTDVGAWNFIADYLTSGGPVRCITLDKPPGQTGYVILTPGYRDNPEIYIKVTLSASRINGRSFHDSKTKRVSA